MYEYISMVSKKIKKMSNIGSYEREVLIGLKKQYNKDEAMQLLFRVLSIKDVEIGKLKSYIDEIKSEKTKIKVVVDDSKLNDLKIKYEKTKGLIQELQRTVEKYKSLREEGVTLKTLNKRDDKIKKLEEANRMLDASRNQLILRLRNK